MKILFIIFNLISVVNAFKILKEIYSNYVYRNSNDQKYTEYKP